MAFASAPSDTRTRALPMIGALAALVASPAVAIFLATNLANAGNLAFNMVFSRLLSPAEFHDLAVILTIKLAILSVFGAVQMAVSQMTARGALEEPAIANLSRLTVLSFGVLFLALPVMLPAALSDHVANALGLEDRRLLAILLLSFPVSLPLCLARGAALGRVAVRGMVISANLEMLVRLVGAVLAWVLDLGLLGIVAAIGASLVAGWWPVRKEVALVSRSSVTERGCGRLARRIAVIAAPFAVLQLAQVGHLDADLLMSSHLLSGAETDLIAGLSLVQRIQFYACFGLAGVLLPTITRALREGHPLSGPILPVAGIVLGTGAVLLGAALVAPETVMTAVAGPSFAPAAAALVPAITAAFCFTVSYIAATLLAALGDRSGILTVALAVPVYITALWACSAQGTLESLVWTKAAAQAGLALCLMLRVGVVLHNQRATYATTH
jgi:O-antigen/teichoic acid export membrane protein